MSLVSIITCTFNRGNLIGETIASVLAQSYHNFEYIIVDDGSDDNTAAVVSSFHDDRISYYVHPRTGGHLSLLRNFAHSKCTGKYVAYIDSDDLWAKDKLECQVKVLEENEAVGFSFTDIDTFNSGGILRKSLYKRTGEATGNVFFQMLANSLIICHTTLLLRKACFDKIGPMDETFHSGDHDRVFYLSHYFNAFAIYRPLVHVRKHAGNSTGDPALCLRLLEEHHRTLEKLYHESIISQKQYKKAHALASYSFGIQLSALNKPKARHYFKVCLSHRPFYWKAWIRLALLSK